MGMISQWVSQIIIFLIVAMVIDLLIPANSFKKYINLVVGIILMLIFLKPIFYLFSIDVQSQLESNIDKLFQEEEFDNSINELTDFKKDEIQAPQDAYILNQMSQQLIHLAEGPLKESYEVEITDIQYIFVNEDKTYDNLTELIVVLKESKHTDDSTVSMVDEIVILEDSNPQKDDNQKEDADDIAQLLWELWELNDINISIKWEGGTN